MSFLFRTSRNANNDHTVSPHVSRDNQEAKNEEEQHNEQNSRAQDNTQNHAVRDEEDEGDRGASMVRKPSDVDKNSERKEKNASASRWIEIFFQDYWNNFISKFKWIIIPIVLIWVGIAIWRVTEFRSATVALEMLPSDHYLRKLIDSLRNDYHTGGNDDTINISIIWGIDGVNRGGIDRWDADNRGKIIWDSNFDMSSTSAQQRILDICNDLRTNSLVRAGTVTCWVQDFVDAQNSGNPVPQVNFYTELENYLLTTNGQNQYSDNQIGYINGTLYFSRIAALSNDRAFQGYSRLYPVYEDWEDLIDQYNQNSPTSINNAFQTGEEQWAYLISQREFVNGAIQGTIIALTFAFAVLLISTLNIVIAIYATLSIS